MRDLERISISFLKLKTLSQRLLELDFVQKSVVGNFEHLKTNNSVLTA
tara:strand:+ start:112 stop:255 length:144 start_codon:yes stop_codon:yes gene_type:complete